MGSELLKITEGFSIVAEGLRGLAKAEEGTKTAEKDTEKTQKEEPSVSEKAQQEQFREESGGSVYAEEGTAAHALAEHKLKKALKRRSKRPVSQKEP